MRLVSRRKLLAWAAAVAAAALGAPPFAAAATKTIDVDIKDGMVVGAKSARVIRGDKVILNWTSDKPMTLHLHGYDIERSVGPDRPTSMSFDAGATGRFPVEAHADDKEKGGHGHKALFHLEVYPK